MPRFSFPNARLRSRLFIVIAHSLAVLFLLVACGEGGSDAPTPTPSPTPAPTKMPLGTPLPTLQPATPSPASSPVIVAPLRPGTATPISRLTGTQCQKDCLVRMPFTDHLVKELGAAGERPSYVVDHWMWAVLPLPLVRTILAEHTSVALVNDSPETWRLYVTHQKTGDAPDEAARALGTVLDFVDGYAVIRAQHVTPIVTDLVDAGLSIEKVAPAPPAAKDVARIARQGPLKAVKPEALLKQVDPQYLTKQIQALQSTSSSDGSGIGTRHHSQPGNAIAAENLYVTLEKMGLRVWYQDFISWDGELNSNVIGEIPGRDQSRVYASMSHLDSISLEDFSAAPGADDNGSGIASNLMIAKILSQYELQYPVRIFFVNAEETSIVGSMALAEQLVTDHVPIEGIFNIDTVGNESFGNRLILNSGPKSSWMSDLLVRINDQYGFGQEIEVHQSESIVADDNMFRNQGMESVLVARLLAGEYSYQHTSEDTLDKFSVDNVTPVCGMVLLSLASLVDGQ